MDTLEFYTQALTEGLPDGVWAFDKSYTLVLGNAAFLDIRKSLYGLDLKPGDSFFKGVPEPIVQKWIPHYNEVFKGKRLILDDSRNVQGNFRQVRISLSPVYNKSNEIIGCMGITIDISEEKKLENDLQQLKSAAADLSKSFRGPLRNSIQKLITLEDQLSHNFNLDLGEKEEIIRLASNELQLIQFSLLQLADMEQLIK